MALALRHFATSFPTDRNRAISRFPRQALSSSASASLLASRFATKKCIMRSASQARAFSVKVGILEAGTEKTGMVLSKTIPLCIRLPGRNTAVLLRAPCEQQYVGDLIKAAIAEFNRLRGFKVDELLLFKIDGSSRILLNAGQTLCEAGVNAGTTLSVEIEGAARPGEPLRFQQEIVGGVSMMVGWLHRRRGLKQPIFLTLEEYRGLSTFLMKAPGMNTPQMLLLLGTIKSGKSTLLQAIEPLVAALREDDPQMHSRPPPVFFKFEFIQRCQAAAAAANLASALRDFARLHGIALQDRDSDPIHHVAAVAGELAQGIDSTGRELWLLFDEAQGPILGSTVGEADVYMHVFKKLIKNCSPFGRIVVTGSGLSALLEAIRKTPPNDFALWDAGVRLTLGREPSQNAALGMAELIVATRSTKWPKEARAVITAQQLVTSLASLGDAPLFSPRPALIAHVADLVCDAPDGSPDEMLAEVLRVAAAKLVQESSYDVARLLLTMDPRSRLTLRKLADHQLGWARQLPGNLRGILEAIFPSKINVGRLVASLCEADWPLRLQPPYGHLVRSGIETDGQISFEVEGDPLVLLPYVQATLTFISDHAASIPLAVQVAASTAVLDAAGDVLCAPRTAGELHVLPAIAAVTTALDV